MKSDMRIFVFVWFVVPLVMGVLLFIVPFAIEKILGKSSDESIILSIPIIIGIAVITTSTFVIMKIVKARKNIGADSHK